MEEIFITEEELDYLTDIPQTVAESPASYGEEPRMSVEEAMKKYNAVTLDEFSKMLDEAIDRLIPNP